MQLPRGGTQTWRGYGIVDNGGCDVSLVGSHRLGEGRGLTRRFCYVPVTAVSQRAMLGHNKIEYNGANVYMYRIANKVSHDLTDVLC